MKLGRVDFPLPDMPRLGVAAFRNRIVFHLVFIALALATLALALALLNEERQRNAQRYEQGFRKSLGEVVAQLRHPSGQLALLNPEPAQVEPGWIAPLVLPFGAIDFDDATKAQRVVDMAGCALQYPGGATLCAAVGSNAYAGGFVYLVATLDAPPLASRERGALDLSGAHRVRVSLRHGGAEQHWLAPVEMLDAQRGQLPGFAVEAAAADTLPRKARPQRDFRGWVWREGPCLAAGDACPRRTTISIRLPVEAFREALFRPGGPQWPPADLARTGLRLALLGPGDATLFDSATPGAQPPLTLARLSTALAPGETLSITRGTAVVALLQGADDTSAPPSPWLTALIQHLPAPATPRTLAAKDGVTTPAGRFDITLTGDLQGLDRTLSASAARLAWPVGAMLAAIALAWLIIEMGLIRRVATLTKRAAALSHQLQKTPELGTLDVADLRGRDELGILAGSLADLLQQVRDSLRREQLRAEREHDQWHAVGHEIMSPLQSLMLLHAAHDDPSRRYVQRMQQAVKVLYGQASPSEALAAATLAVNRLDLNAFLRGVAENAAYAGIADVAYAPAAEPVWVQADEYPLEDAITHVLTNADRYRAPGTPVTLTLRVDGELATVDIHNQGPRIADDQLARIFDYGVSDAEPQDGQRRGQGLFVAKTYLAKMGGRIAARNADDGVVFEIGLRTR
ncbi:HAMP domain-containing sensor histidine kinase [Roseateles asaccharophilus]|uniref:histidine kinase n=1 Tax=Roseateles asaccharophilus TaxID=582607 RepID=A0ABU2AF47_9BURK|nr:HAMP domain-containing sensor histidine kinase [Roseateles asaccharophilus]MDR7335822.1 signal transduction histidine kinase [Roseateles asaccharophilus]